MRRIRFVGTHISFCAINLVKLRRSGENRGVFVRAAGLLRTEGLQISLAGNKKPFSIAEEGLIFV